MNLYRGVLSMSKIKLKYKKGEAVRFIGHLDLVRVFYRAVRRAGLPMAYSKGFNPHPKISFGPALKLGQISDNEFLTLHLEEDLPPEEIRKRLNAVLPTGLSLDSSL